MHGPVLFAVFLFFLVAGVCPARAGQVRDFGDCLSCHQGIAPAGSGHVFECAKCHLRPQDREKSLADHGTVVRNPSDTGTAGLFCVECHKQEFEVLETSLHATLNGIINQTRYLWGAQKTASPPLYSANNALAPLPAPPDFPKGPARLVDDFLRKKCLRCHIGTKGLQVPGLYRASGCAACHVLYNENGLYAGDDPAMDKTRPGYPARHGLTGRIPDSQCLRCHNANHVGADYHGLFERDAHSMFQEAVTGGRKVLRLYGGAYHRLSKDAHAEAGLSCIDCHTKEDVMGNGSMYGFALEASATTCQSCHGGFGKTPNLDLAAIERTPDGYVFNSKDGQARPLPTPQGRTPGHDKALHGRVRCGACHARWSFQDYGLSALRLDRGDLTQWDFLAGFDPEFAAEIAKSREVERVALLSLDPLLKDTTPGVWVLGRRFRRWEPMPLGLDHQGRFALLRPKYQYLVSYVNVMGQSVLDGVSPIRGDGLGKGWAFSPYVPHTIAGPGRTCRACHGNRVAAGLGLAAESTPDLELMVPSAPAISSMRLLNKKEREQLMNPSKEFKRKDFLEQHPLLP